MKKLLKILLAAAILTLSQFNIAYAADITVTCDESDCVMTPAPGAALFDESEFPQYDLKPGDNVSRKLKVNNNGGATCIFTLSSATIKHQNPSTFAQRLLTAIRSGGTDIYGITSGGIATNNKNLEDLLTTDFPTLGTIGPGQSKEFVWYVAFDPMAGNEYQLARLVFDFDMNFSCDGPFTTPTPTPTTTPTGSPGPTPTPTGSPGPTPTPTVPPTFPPFFTPTPTLPGAVGGAETYPTPTPGSVAGESTCCSTFEPWWWILLMSQILFLTFHYLKKISEDEETDWIIVASITTIVSILLHFILHKIFTEQLGYQEHELCEYFWLLSIIFNLLISLVYKKYYKGKDEK